MKVQLCSDLQGSRGSSAPQEKIRADSFQGNPLRDLDIGQQAPFPQISNALVSRMIKNTKNHLNSVSYTFCCKKTRKAIFRWLAVKLKLIFFFLVFAQQETGMSSCLWIIGFFSWKLISLKYYDPDPNRNCGHHRLATPPYEIENFLASQI